MNKPNHPRLSFNLRARLIALLVVVVILPFSLFGSWLIRNMTLEMEDQLQENARSTHELMAQQLGEVFVQCNTLADIYANDWTLNRQLRHSYPNIMDAYPLYETLWERSATMILTWVKLKYITIYTENKTLASTTPFIIRTDAYLESLADWPLIVDAGYIGYWCGIRGARSSSAYWDPKNQGASSRHSFSYTRLLSKKRTPDNNAYITLEVDATALTDIIAMRDDDIANFLVDQQGRLVAPLNAPEFDALAAHIHYGDPSLRSESFHLDGHIGWQTALQNGWILVSSASLNRVAQAAMDVQRTALTGLVSMCALILLMVFVWSFTMTRRMRKLAGRMASFWATEKEHPTLPEADEIAMLEHSFDEMVDRLHDAIENEYVQEVKRKQAELDLLHTQINPHFLYNTLSSIAWLTDTNSMPTVRGAIEDMAKFFRLSLSKGRSIISLGEELQVLQAYMNLQKLRFQNRVRFTMDADELLLSARIPRLTLQPLVENSLIHGPGEQRRPVSITVTAALSGEDVVISVLDDGVGMDAAQLSALMDGSIESQFGNGLGYATVNERIALYFGPKYGLSLQSEPGRGTRIDVRIPLDAAQCSDVDMNARIFGL